MKKEDWASAMQCFPVFRGEAVPPLKVGILQDVFARGVPEGLSRRDVRRFLAHVCRNNSGYRKRLLAGGPRFDLDGNPCGAITSQEQQDAAAKPKAGKAKPVLQKAAACKARLRQSPNPAAAIPVRRRGRSWSKDAPL